MSPGPLGPDRSGDESECAEEHADFGARDGHTVEALVVLPEIKGAANRGHRKARIGGEPTRNVYVENLLDQTLDGIEGR
jgi:hypothetical protein